MAEGDCKHSACHCTGEEIQADGYCEVSCKEGRMDNGKCACGHPDCA